MIVVSNTSPISNLATVERLHLLQKIYHQIVIPSAVYQELTNQGAGDVVSTAVRTSTWIQIRSVTDQTMVKSLQDQLNVGEAEAIILAIELQADELLGCEL